jgi:hypothetical protein
MATTGRNGRPSTATPEEIEAERKQTEDQSVAEDGDAIDIRRELVERQQHHDNDDDGRPEVGPSFCGRQRGSPLPSGLLAASARSTC